MDVFFWKEPLSEGLSKERGTVCLFRIGLLVILGGKMVWKSREEAMKCDLILDDNLIDQSREGFLWDLTLKLLVSECFWGEGVL